MKYIPFILSILCLTTVCFSAEQAVLKAELSETDKDGRELQTFAYVKHELTMLKNLDRVSSFLFEETMGPPPCSDQICPMMPSWFSSTVFTNVRKSPAGCGSVRYTGRNKKSRIEVVDHS